MKKSKFIKSTLILIVGGFITKILGMIIKIVLTRKIGTTGIGIYTLILPTYTLLIAIAQLGFPVAISKLVAEDKYNNKRLVLGIIPFSLLLNFIIMVLLIIFAKTLSINLLHDERTYYGIMMIGFVLPFISISSILRGYFFGKERMLPHIFSNITEDLIRLLIIAIILPFIIPKGIEFTIAFIIFSSIFSELASIIIFLFCAPKKMNIRTNDFIPKKTDLSNILNISIPTTGSRLIGSVGYFLEPIIITYVLIKIGYSNNFIVDEYGIINGYVMPLLLLPSFFTMAISQALIPVISKAHAKKQYNYVKCKLKQAIGLSLLIGIPATCLFFFFPGLPLKFMYDTTLGINYLKILAPICLLYYIQTPIVSTLQAIGKSKEAMKGTLYGMIIRTFLLFSLSYFKIGLWGLIISIGFNIVFVTLYHAQNIRKNLKGKVSL